MAKALKKKTTKALRSKARTVPKGSGMSTGTNKKMSTDRGRPAKKSLNRRTVSKNRAATAGKSLPYFVHPKGLADSTEIGPRTRIWAFAHVLKGAVIGCDCNIGECVFVEPEVVLGNHVTIKNGVQVWTGVTCEDYVFVGPNATFTNDLRPRVAHPTDPADYAKTHVCYGASIGANATIVAGNTIGSHAMIGAGTVVIRDVPAHALMVGNPARRIGWICACGEKLPESLVCPKCAKRYERADLGLRPLL